MSWEWSHTREAYDDAEDNVRRKKSMKWLRECWAEIKAAEKKDNGGYELDLHKYDEAYKRAKRMTRAQMADEVWAFMEEFRTCDNGGWNAHCCPWGCHTVPFDKIKREAA